VLTFSLLGTALEFPGTLKGSLGLCRADLTQLASLTNLAGGLAGDPLVNLLVSTLDLQYLGFQWGIKKKKYSAEYGMTRAVQKHPFRNRPLIF